MPAVKDVGEPCAGEPHARFDVAAGGNQASRQRRAARRLPPTSRERRARADACWITRARVPERLLVGTSQAIRKHLRDAEPEPASHPSSFQSATPGRSVAAARRATTGALEIGELEVLGNVRIVSLSFPGVIASLAGGLSW